MNLENEVAIVGSVFEGNEKLRTALTGLKTLSESGMVLVYHEGEGE